MDRETTCRRICSDGPQREDGWTAEKSIWNDPLGVSKRQPEQRLVAANDSGSLEKISLWLVDEKISGQGMQEGMGCKPPCQSLWSCQ